MRLPTVLLVLVASVLSAALEEELVSLEEGAPTAQEWDSAAQGRSTRIHDVAEGTLGALGEAVKAEVEDRALPLSQEKEFPGYARRNLTKTEIETEKKAADEKEALDRKLAAQKKKNALAEALKIKNKAKEKLQKAKKIDQSVADDIARLKNGKVADEACKDKPSVKCAEKKALCDSPKEADKKDARSNCPATCGVCDGLAVPQKMKTDSKATPGGKWVVAQVQKQAQAAVKSAVAQASARVKQLIADSAGKQSVVKATADKIKSLLSAELADKPGVLSTVDSVIATVEKQSSSPETKTVKHAGSATVKDAIDMLKKPTAKKAAAKEEAKPSTAKVPASNSTANASNTSNTSNTSNASVAQPSGVNATAVAEPAANATNASMTGNATSNATTNETKVDTVENARFLFVFDLF